jgi:hypothetical protein
MDNCSLLAPVGELFLFSFILFHPVGGEKLATEILPYVFLLNVTQLYDCDFVNHGNLFGCSLDHFLRNLLTGMAVRFSIEVYGRYQEIGP